MVFAALARKPDPAPQPRILHVGAGGSTMPPWLGLPAYTEVRLDIVADFDPDIVASMLDMGDIGQFHGLYTSHCLEHVYPHEVAIALAEFLRVLIPGGMAIIIVPDLEDVRPTDDVLYGSPAGPICGLDLFYGYRPLLAGLPHMAHHTGFTAASLGAAMTAAGFGKVKTARFEPFNLMGVGCKP